MGFEKGRAPKVKDRWYGDHNYRYRREFTPREFKGEAQFTFDDLYITPFTHRRHYSENGRLQYEPIERNMNPTGIHVMDDFLRCMSRGDSNVSAFCKRYGARINDLESLIFLLTGMRGIEFRYAYQRRLADDILRYTSLPVADIARLCGYGSRINFYFAYKRDYKCSPSERRLQLQKPEDIDLYKVEQ